MIHSFIKTMMTWMHIISVVVVLGGERVFLGLLLEPLNSIWVIDLTSCKLASALSSFRKRLSSFPAIGDIKTAHNGNKMEVKWFSEPLIDYHHGLLNLLNIRGLLLDGIPAHDRDNGASRRVLNLFL